MANSKYLGICPNCYLGTLEAVSKSDDSVINPESVQELSWEVAIPENISDISDVKVIFMDS